MSRHLPLSTKNIEKISSLAGQTKKQVLSLGRNCIKKLEGLEPVAPTLKQLWISYNAIEKLVGVLAQKVQQSNREFNAEHATTAASGAVIHMRLVCTSAGWH